MFEQFVAELKASVRLRIGLALVVSVLWLNGLLSLREQVDEAVKRHGQLAGQLNRTRQYAAQTDWPERAKQAQMAQVELEGRLWRSGTPGLAQAAFQDWLDENLGKAGVTRQEIVLIQDGANKADEDLWKIKAKLSVDFTPQGFNALMQRLASADRQVIVEKLVIHAESSPRVEAILAAPFQKSVP